MFYVCHFFYPLWAGSDVIKLKVFNTESGLGFTVKSPPMFIRHAESTSDDYRRLVFVYHREDHDSIDQ